jgi:hypothetical protein
MFIITLLSSRRGKKVKQYFENSKKRAKDFVTNKLDF